MRERGAPTRVHGAETGEKRLWWLWLKTATQVQNTWRVGPQLAKIEEVGQIRPSRRPPKVSRFLTPKPWAEQRIWTTSHVDVIESLRAREEDEECIVVVRPRDSMYLFGLAPSEHF